MERPHVSVVIVTRNRPAVVGQAVGSVLANDYPSFDLTVVDQSTGGDTAAALAAYEADARLRYLHTPIAGVSRACNIGIRASTGPIVAFTDDDCLVPRNWLFGIVRSFAARPDAGMLFGEVHVPIGPARLSGITPHMRIKRPAALTWAKRYQLGFRVFGGMGANFAARREVLEAIAGFDELLGPGAPLPSGQDFDLAYRALHAGTTILLRPEVRVIHQYGTRTWAEWMARQRDYGAGDGAMYGKHIRCLDGFALLLFLRWLTRRSGRELIKRWLQRKPSDLTYARALVEGVWRSFTYGVDTKQRMYVRRSADETPLIGACAVAEKRRGAA